MAQDSSPFIQTISDLVDQRQGEAAFRAIVQAATATSATIRRTGQEVDDSQPYPILSSAGLLAAGDEVLCLRVGRGLVVIGKILRP